MEFMLQQVEIATKECNAIAANDNKCQEGNKQGDENSSHQEAPALGRVRYRQDTAGSMYKELEQERA